MEVRTETRKQTRVEGDFQSLWRLHTGFPGKWLIWSLDRSWKVDRGFEERNMDTDWGRDGGLNTATHSHTPHGLHIMTGRMYRMKKSGSVFCFCEFF